MGVHPNTVRAWTDQGRLHCLRINERGDRRYRVADLEAFLDAAGIQAGPITPFKSRMQPTPREWDASPLAPEVAEESDLVAAAPAPRPDADGREMAALAAVLKEQLRTHDLEGAAKAVVRTLHDAARFTTVAVAEWRDGKLTPRAMQGPHRARAWWSRIDPAFVEICLREGRPIAVPAGELGTRASGSETRPATVEVFTPIGSGAGAWGVLLVESPADRPLGRQDLDLLQAAANALALAAEQSRLARRENDRQSQARALASISTDLASRLDYPEIMSALVDHAMDLFHADRACVYRRLPDGRLTAEFARNLSSRWTQFVAEVPSPSLGALAIESRRALAAVDYANDPRAAGVREAVVREGFDSVAIAPLLSDGDVLGILALYHDQPRPWSPDDLQVLEALAAQAGVAVKNARNYEKMATWAAQLQSIQQLGTRLNRLTTVSDIGHAICVELKQLIDYHNVRVYRVHAEDVVPVAWRGEIGEYTDEDDEQLRLRVGQGITGWVADHGVAQYLPDAANDPRSQTIPGTEDDLDESMLLAPMLYEDNVIGVIVLSKLGVNQFTGDDLRYLEIYASIAAQAMINADATEQLRAQSERLARQLAGQQELMRVTESILSTLDPRTVVEEIADRLGGLIHVDNLAINVYDADAHLLTPLFARGADAERYMSRTLSDQDGIAGWVARNGEAQLVEDETADPRVAHFDGVPHAGALIVAPLRARDRVAGVLTLERLGSARFEEQEFELIQLFAGHVSIALQNALAHRAVEIRAQTDSLTELKNQGTFKEVLSVAAQRGTAFSLLIVDLDDFKAFNDRRGHEAGNLLLADIARALTAACRDTDEVFRYGGDEFALLLPNTDGAGAMEVAAKVGRAVRSVPAPGSRKAAGVTCSIGVAAFPADAASGSELLLAADRACYVAKRRGRNLSATAAEGRELAGEFLPEPTPVDEPGPSQHAA